LGITLFRNLKIAALVCAAQVRRLSGAVFHHQSLPKVFRQERRKGSNQFRNGNETFVERPIRIILRLNDLHILFGCRTPKPVPIATDIPIRQRIDKRIQLAACRKMIVPVHRLRNIFDRLVQFAEYPRIQLRTQLCVAVRLVRILRRCQTERTHLTIVIRKKLGIRESTIPSP